MFRVKNIFPTIQGEGSKTGTPAIFVRFVGCNLWSGKDSSRKKAKGHCGLWCDTDFIKGIKMSLDDIFESVESHSKNVVEKVVVLTGGEPFLQLKGEKGLNLVKKFLKNNYTVCVETNGTIKNEVTDYVNIHPKGHITVSPKPLMDYTSNYDHVLLKEGTDLKIIVPTSFNLEKMRNLNFEYFYLQPMDTKIEKTNQINTYKAIELARKFGYKISVQTHKYIGVE